METVDTTYSYTSKPATIRAVQWKGDNAEEVIAFAGTSRRPGATEDFPTVHVIDGDPEQRISLYIHKSGVSAVQPLGTWIIAEPDGSGMYPCDAATFATRWSKTGPTWKLDTDELADLAVTNLQNRVREVQVVGLHGRLLSAVFVDDGVTFQPTMRLHGHTLRIQLTERTHAR
ncbi:hypothetical protein SEA_MORGANA_75 [Gordonia phage Morgana]|uniref:Uncharacterized protein n=1 Tax=Gordonia phage Morgana TaxID=3137292 RepID=A0AAX4RBS3_9CAUD